MTSKIMLLVCLLKAAQGTGHKAKTTRKTILSVCLAPYAFCLKPLLLAKPLNFDLL
jgi:hypothetical protein